MSISVEASVKSQINSEPIQSVNADARYEHSFTVVQSAAVGFKSV